ncbi:MAG: prephenate dehydratase [Ginsengibacter sp.]
MANAYAIQGFEGSFHQAAAQHFFGNDVEIICCNTFQKVISVADDIQLSAGGIMAIENSIAGTILPNYQLLQKSNLIITGEIYLKIDQNLLTDKNTTLEDIREVHSHPMALLQCSDFLEKHNWKLVATEDTALSARHVAENHCKHIAAIAGSCAAEIFDLNILVPNIHTEKSNFTRFWILENKKVAQKVENADKASIQFTTDHSKGSLAKVLYKISESGINLRKLQSMPIPGSDWKYSFHADCEFNQYDQFQEMISNIKPVTAEIKIYGIYKNNKP